MNALVRSVFIVRQVFGLLIGRNLADPLTHVMGGHQPNRSVW